MAFLSPVVTSQEMLPSLGLGKGHWGVLRWHNRSVLEMCVLALFGMAIDPWRSKASTPGRVGYLCPMQEW